MQQINSKYRWYEPVHAERYNVAFASNNDTNLPSVVWIFAVHISDSTYLVELITQPAFFINL